MRHRNFKTGDHVEVIIDDADAFGGSIGDHGIVTHIVKDRIYIKFEKYTPFAGARAYPSEVAEGGGLYVTSEGLRIYTPLVYAIREEPWYELTQ